MTRKLRGLIRYGESLFFSNAEMHIMRLNANTESSSDTGFFSPSLLVQAHATYSREDIAAQKLIMQMGAFASSSSKFKGEIWRQTEALTALTALMLLRNEKSRARRE